MDGTRIAARYYPGGTEPLLVALHGGTYTSAYYNVPGSALGSFVDLAQRNGLAVLTIDRPGYGASGPLASQQNTFVEQGRLLARAIGDLLATVGAGPSVLLGHSVGGMIALEVAAAGPRWPLIGLALSGMGATLRGGGAADGLSHASRTGMVDLPVDAREAAMLGPAGSVTPRARVAAQSAYAAAPAVELRQAPGWARRRLETTAACVSIPVHHAVGEFDALWDSSDKALAAFRAVFVQGPTVVSERVAGAGHSIGHHRMATSFHLRQLPFSLDCVQAAEQDR